MKQTISEYQFKDAFTSGSHKDNFSYEGLTALYEYFTNYEEDCDTEIEFDVVAICCEYTEYTNIEEFSDNYDEVDKKDFFEDDGKIFNRKDYQEAVEEYINDNTQLIKLTDNLDDGFIILAF